MEKTLSKYLHEQLDLKTLHQQFKLRDRLLVRDFFAEPVAQAIYQNISQLPWMFSYRQANQDRILSQTHLDALSDTERMALGSGIVEEAQRNFQFSFFSYSLAEAAARGDDHLLARMTRYMAGEEFMQAMRELTGVAEIKTLYAQATMYTNGSFLMLHDDKVNIEDRRIAYVLNLTPTWRPDWGGLLQFTDNNSNVTETFTPHFNSLSLFTVPQNHIVSYVAPFATAPRYAITGWFIA